MNHDAIIAFSGFSDGGTNGGIFGIVTLLFIFLAFAPIGAILSGGWSLIGGLIWLIIDSVIVWRLWTSVTSLGHRRRWYLGWTRAIASTLVLLAYLGLNLMIASAVDNLRYAALPTP